MSVQLHSKEFAGTFVCSVASKFNDKDIINATFHLERGPSVSHMFLQSFFDACHTYFSECLHIIVGAMEDRQ